MGATTKYWLLLVCLLATIYGSFVLWRRDQATSLDAAPFDAGTRPVAIAPQPREDDARPASDAPFKDFVLTDQQGRTFDSRSLHGKVWVGSFFFTNCPAICWRLNQTLAALQETNPASEAHFVSITCDPDNDTPAALAKYAAHFKADPKRWTFLTGDMNLIRSIGNDTFKVAVETSTHSDRAFVVDRNGKVRGRFRLTEPDQFEMLKKLLAMVEAEPLSEDADASHNQPADEGAPIEGPPVEDTPADEPAATGDANATEAATALPTQAGS
jgi:protein SCO1/2